MRRLGVTLTVAAVLLTSQVASADVITCATAQDAFTTYYDYSGGYPAESSGSGGTMKVYGREDIMVSFLQFDLSGLTGHSGNQIDSAQMKLFCSYYEATTSSNPGFGVYYAESAWNEATYDASVAAPPSWGSLVVDVTQTGNGWYTIDVTDAVKAWQDGKTNNGLVLIAHRYQQRRTYFYQKETSYPVYAPKLEVTTVPEPASMSLLVAGALTCFGFGRKRS